MDRFLVAASRMTLGSFFWYTMYYSMPFCPHEGKAKVDESLGEWFLGGRIRGAPFDFTFLKKEEYTPLCKKEMGRKDVRHLKNTIDQKYRVRLILDNLPVTRLSVDKFFELAEEYGKNAIFDTVDESFSYIGYPIGGKDGDKYYVNNHLTFSILYNDAEAKTITKGFYIGEAGVVEEEEAKDTEGKYNIVGFQVLPCSVEKHILESPSFKPEDCGMYDKQYVSPGTEVTYS